MTTVKVNPTLQEIVDKDTAVNDFLVKLANNTSIPADERIATILAVGLSAIHERLGEMWRWDKAVDPS